MNDSDKNEIMTLWQIVDSEISVSGWRIRAIRRIAKLSSVKPTKEELELMESYLDYVEDEESKETLSKAVSQYRLKRGSITR